MQGTLHGHDCCIFIDTLGEAHAGVGNLTQRLRTLTDVVMSELRCLEHDRRGGIQDLGIETAHDACQCDRLLPITDNKVFCGQCELFLIEGNDLLAFFCTADMDLAAFKIREIESMHRLAEFLKDIVRNIYDIGDRGASDESQTALHPCRRLSDLDIGNIVADISRAQILCRYADIERDLHIGLGIVECRLFERLAENGSDFTCNTEDALAVRTVCRDRDIEDIVIEPQDRLYIRTRFRIFRKYQKSVITGTREHILTDTDLDAGAEHTIGIVSSEFTLADGHQAFYSYVIFRGRIHLRADQRERVLSAGGNIIRAAADLQCAVGSCIHLTKMEMCSLDRITSLHETYDNITDVVSDLVLLFYLETTGKELLLQFIRGNIDIYIIF